jgi:hypothetical protein
MKSKTINVPVYECGLTIILTKDLNEVVKKYKLNGEFGNFGALTFENKSKHRNYVVAFTDASHLSNIAHGINAKIDLHNDEPEAYLTGWLFDKIYEFLNQEQ